MYRGPLCPLCWNRSQQGLKFEILQIMSLNSHHCVFIEMAECCKVFRAIDFIIFLRWTAWRHAESFGVWDKYYLSLSVSIAMYTSFSARWLPSIWRLWMNPLKKQWKSHWNHSWLSSLGTYTFRFALFNRFHQGDQLVRFSVGFSPVYSCDSNCIWVDLSFFPNVINLFHCTAKLSTTCDACHILTLHVLAISKSISMK